MDRWTKLEKDFRHSATFLLTSCHSASSQPPAFHSPTNRRTHPRLAVPHITPMYTELPLTSTQCMAFCTTATPCHIAFAYIVITVHKILWGLKRADFCVWSLNWQMPPNQTSQLKLQRVYSVEFELCQCVMVLAHICIQCLNLAWVMCILEAEGRS